MKLFDINLIPVRETDDYIDYFKEKKEEKSVKKKQKHLNQDKDN